MKIISNCRTESLKITRFLAFLLPPFSFLLLASCLTLGKVSTSEKPLILYNPGKIILHPQFTVFNVGEKESMVFFKVLTSEVVFNQANSSVRNQARLTLYSTLYSSYDKKTVAARDTQSFVIDRETVDEAIIASIKLPTEKGKTYLLDVTLEDEIRQSGARELILVDRFSEEPRQDWLILNQPNNHVAFESFYYPNESFRIIKNSNASGRIYVAVFKPRNVLPLPPFSLEEQPNDAPIPDSSFSLAYSEQLQYKLGGEGIYVFHFNPDKIKGLCLTQFGEDYPQIVRPDNMLPPLQYISTREEYLKLVAAEDHKKAVDDFWLARGKTFANSRDLIRVYYNRVVFANLYFPSAKQGWKTDRGMIYVIMGPPFRVDRTETTETWHYESSQTTREVEFEFNLTDDFWWGFDFELKRKEDYRVLWNTAVDSWRRGKIFSL
ncbi:MAG: GWxTD domain-containing protein [Bacteroidota bacterium]